MPAVNSQSDRGDVVRPRRTVRIVKPRTLPRTATVSLAVALGAAVCLLALWHFWQREEVVPPHQRILTEWETDWKCDDGHMFHAAGQVEPRACWTCGKPAYPVASYKCPGHGAYEVTARFTLDDNGNPKVSHLRLPGRSWVSVEGGLRCPRCSRRLVYEGPDPMWALRHRMRQSGG